ncbi:SH3 domain-binding protein 2 isoform X2 [Acanthopagrus latus]|uniref:SH3 domain-binding protein 2 isoform X2 n=1 Tax=Acanthopagrus latus TaxID=8177 RepID=UPI00187CDB1C|nr:SH3 domain-binding protein 2 isoform X2 [Acanthopagrus latus]
MRPECDQRRLRADRQIPLSLDLMRRNSEPTEDRKKRSPGPVGCLVAVSVMDLLPALGSTVLASTVSRLRESAAVQSINRRLRRRTMSSPEVCWPVPMRAIGAQNLLTMPGGVSISGYLHKKGGSQFSLMKWPLRYTIIHKGCVYYFKSSTSPAPQGAFSLNGYNRVMRAAEETTSSNVFPFKIVHFSKKHRTWFFSAASEDERRKWMRHLRREIDHYNDRKESHIPSDSDSDNESFYGTIEKPMDIKQPIDNAEDDYGEDDDDDDEEDYLKPDGDCSQQSAVRQPGPPPSYPPPPVPAVFPLRQDSSPGFHKGPAPPAPPQHRNPNSALPKKPPPSFPPPSILKDASKGPPPPIPFAPHLQKTLSSTPPLPPPPNAKRTLQSRATSVGVLGNDRRVLPAVSIHSPATLPICDQLESRMVLNGPAHCALNAGGTQSLGNHRIKPSLPPPHPVNVGGAPHRPAVSNTLSLIQTLSSHPPLPGQPPHSPLPRTGLHNKPAMPKPPPPSAKPPLPAVKSKPGAPLQASPDGQSFRSLGDETPADFRRKRDSSKRSEEGDSDDDYENVQLPESVYIDTTETSFVEKLFKESPDPPQDGLYCIRNSGTKTSKVLVVWDIGINKARNYRLFEEEDLVFLDSEVTFPTLSDLIEHYYSHPLPHHGSLCLQKPYTNPLSS